jgi:chemotaxis protein CheC
MQTNTDSKPLQIWADVIKDTSREGLLYQAMAHVADDLTTLTGRLLEINSLVIETIPLKNLAGVAADAEMEAVGIYLLLTDEALSGEAVIILSPADAMRLVDWLLEEPPGTTTQLDTLEHSALAEFGNQALSSFLNTLADSTGMTLRLSPPGVMVDVIGAIFEAVAMSAAALSDEVLVIKTEFVNDERSLTVQFWVIPDFISPVTPVSTATKQWQWDVLEDK